MTELVADIQSDKVGGAVRRGAMWTFVQIGGRHAISLLSTAILARLLSADQYGVVGMMTTLTTFLVVFADMGLSWATIQRRQLTADQVSNLFWINLVAGLALWGVCALLAGPIADFYGRTELLSIAVVVGANFVLSGAAAQPVAMLTRTMRFRNIAMIELSALALGAIASVTLALNGAGYWALVIQPLVASTARLLLAWTMSGIRVRLPRTGTGSAQLARFGALIALNGVLIYAARNLDSVFVGKVLGAEKLGLYNRAYFLMLLPSMLATTSLNRLMVPALAALQAERGRFANAYRRALRISALVACPIAAGMVLTASELIHLVYGEKWLAVAPLLVWLSIAGITQPIYNTTGWLFTAAGKPSAYLAVTLTNAVVLVAVFALTVGHGLEALSAGYGLVMGIVLLVPCFVLAHRAADIALWPSVQYLVPVAVCVAIMVAAVLVAGQFAAALSWQAQLGIKVVVGVVAYAMAAGLLLRRVIVDDIFASFRRRAE